VRPPAAFELDTRSVRILGGFLPGFSRRFFVRSALFLSESKTPPYVFVRTLITENIWENLIRTAPCSSDSGGCGCPYQGRGFAFSELAL
jgi:hypothetical protein